MIIKNIYRSVAGRLLLALILIVYAVCALVIPEAIIKQLEDF